MAFVGPRPHPIKLDRRYEEDLPRLYKRYAVLPGLTGLSQVRGLRGAITDRKGMRKRLRLDLFYIRNRSLALDFKIFIATLLLGFWHVYEKDHTL